MRAKRVIPIGAMIVFGLIVLGTAFATNARLLDGVLGSDAPFTASSQAIFDGKLWIIGRNSGADRRCIELRSPDGWSSLSCPAAIHAGKPILAETGGTGNVRYLYGDVLGAVAKILLVRADCTSEVLPVSSAGTFLAVYDASAPAPSKVVAVGDGGRAVRSFAISGRGGGALPPDSC